MIPDEDQGQARREKIRRFALRQVQCLPVLLLMESYDAQALGRFHRNPNFHSWLRRWLHTGIWVRERQQHSRCRDRYIGDKMKPAIYGLLQSGQCGFIPTILWCISQNLDKFYDSGETLKALARHNDREVRWRVAYVISKMPHITGAMVDAIELMESEDDGTTQVYFQECLNSKKWPNKSIQTDGFAAADL